jgi:hypothetical protein
MSISFFHGQVSLPFELGIKENGKMREWFAAENKFRPIPPYFKRGLNKRRGFIGYLWFKWFFELPS